MTRVHHRSISLIVPFLLWALLAPQLPRPEPPGIGDKAPEFVLGNIQGKRVKLTELREKSDVVLVVLRGYPGYQCPLCNLQVRDFVKNSSKFSEAGAKLVLVYPGPAEKLEARAAEFAADKVLPANAELLLDPGYEFTNRYGLRWDATGETAYPSTFLIDSAGGIFFARIRKTHGGRTSAAETLDALSKRKRS